DFSQFRFSFGRSAEAGPFGESVFDRGEDSRVSMPEDVRPPRADVIDEAVAIDVEEVRAIGAVDDRGVSADAAERAGGTVHAAGDGAGGALELGEAIGAGGHVGRIQD